jgi:AcrR family transcriptional regulator
MSPVKASHTARERARAELTREITEEARRQLADTGATGLSLRAVARELGMVSSALYRYFPSRDDLLTALIIDAYNALGEAAETAAAAADLSPRRRWLAACHAIRDWALARPHEYALIYGSPVPGYRAPQATIGPASRVPLAFARVLADAVAGGALRTGDGPALDGALSAQAGLLAAALVESGASDVPPDALVRAVIAWAQLYGMISFELFGQFVGSFEPVDALFDYAVAELATFVGLERQAPEDRHGISALYRNFSICSSVASHNLFSSTFCEPYIPIGGVTRSLAGRNDDLRDRHRWQLRDGDQRQHRQGHRHDRGWRASPADRHHGQRQDRHCG